jgi:hypothetical protein
MQPCPKCQYQRTAEDRSTYAGVCPRCGIAYAKWGGAARVEPAPQAIAATVPYIEVYPPLGQRLRSLLLDVPLKVSPVAWWARVALAVGLALWTVYFGWHGVSWEVIGGSFLHNANLAFHEFGHLLFLPFGEFMSILGGSLFQVLLPVSLVFVFVLRQHDNFAAAVALWWSGQNLVDLAPLHRDAEYRMLPLIGGLGEQSHDWGNLLTLLGWLDQAQLLARTSFTVGLAVMVLALLWGARLLQLQQPR